MSRQERGAMRAKIAARRAETIVEEATERIVAARPSQTPSPQTGSELDRAQEVKRLRDEEKLSWMAIGAKLSLPGSKNGAGTARRYYAMVNRGEVPRTQAPRKGSTPKPTGPASRGVPAYMRKEALVRDGHVIPRDMPDEEVEALVLGRRIEWAIDLAKLTSTDPETWGPEDRRWVPQEAKVHVNAEWVRVMRDEDTGDRVLYFREYGGWDSDRNRHMSGPTRVVRVDSIYTVA
jgi:hypothetical protein